MTAKRGRPPRGAEGEYAFVRVSGLAHRSAVTMAERMDTTLTDIATAGILAIVRFNTCECCGACEVCAALDAIEDS
jgi:hypothetical protein